MNDSPTASSPASADAGPAPSATLLDRVGPWPLRVAWFLLPFTVGGALDAVLDGQRRSLVLVATALAWASWAVSLLATLVAHPASLTALRLAGPTVSLGALFAVAVGRPALAAAVPAIVVGCSAGALALSASTADRCVDGASYGSEQRLALRIPTSLLAGPLPLAWLCVALGVPTGPLLLASQRWVLGGVLTVIGWPLAGLAVRSVHGLSQRFIVLVPAGFVLHDRAALLDPVLFSRHAMVRLGPALADTDATDLSLGAAGLLVEVRLVQPLDVPVRTGRRQSEMRSLEAVLFSPARPGRLLQQAAAHQLPVG